MFIIERRSCFLHICLKVLIEQTGLTERKQTRNQSIPVHQTAEGLRLIRTSRPIIEQPHNSSADKKAREYIEENRSLGHIGWPMLKIKIYVEVSQKKTRATKMSEYRPRIRTRLAYPTISAVPNTNDQWFVLTSGFVYEK